MADFEPGWLARTVHDAHIRCMADHEPLFPAPIDERPISAADTFELFKVLDRRFEAWTGKTLAEYLAAGDGQSTGKED